MSASLLVALSVAVLLFPAPRAANPAGLGFLELDGNVVPGNCVGPNCESGTSTCASPITSSSQTDWACLFTQLSTFTGKNSPTAAQIAAAYTSNGLPLHAVASSFVPNGYSGGPLCPISTGSSCPKPTTYTSGSKDILDISANTCGSGNSLLAKDYLVNTYGIKYIDPATGHQIAYVGDEKLSNGGDNNIGVWFDQEAITLPLVQPSPGVFACPTGSGAPFVGSHTVGDLLTVSNFTKGGTLAGINAYKWVGSASSCPSGTAGSPPLCLEFSGNVCDPSALSTQFVCGIVSHVITPGVVDGSATGNICGFPWVTASKELGGMNNSLTSGTLHCTAVNSFYEMGIDLTALGFTSCKTNAIPETRSSQSLTATLFDFTLLNLNSCATKTTTSASQQGIVTPGTPVTDAATVTASAGGGSPAGTVQFYTCGPFASSPTFSTCDSSKAPLGSGVTLTPAASNSSTATSISFSPIQPGYYCFEAAYTPTAASGFLPSASTDLAKECFVVVASSIKTNVSPSTISFGNSANDTATVTLSLSTATVSGTVDFTVYGPVATNSATCTTSAGSFLAVPIGPATGSASATSPNFTPTAAGYYFWIAKYNPATMANGNSAMTGCGDTGETLLVVQSAITTNVSPSTVAFGSTASDTATVTLTPGTQPVSGTIDFTVYGPVASSAPTCTTVATSFTGVAISGPGTGATATSGSFNATAPGYYFWIARYNPSGPANGNSVTTSCGDKGETLLVVQSAIATNVSPAIITFGQTAKDTATVTLTPNTATVSGSVDFFVYGPVNANSPMCTTLANSFLTVSIGPGTGSASATSPSFKPSGPGFYFWTATYHPTGPANGNAVSTNCGDTGETLQVLSIPKITAFNFTNTPTNNDPTLGTGTVTYSITIHNYGATAVTLSGNLTISGTASITCTGGKTLTLSGSLAAGADATFNLTCNYSGISGQTVQASVNAFFTDLNNVTGKVSGSPTTYIFTIETT